MVGELSVTMSELLERRDHLAKMIDLAIREYRSRSEKAAELSAQYEEAWHKAYLRSEGTIPERKSKAVLHTIGLYRDLEVAKALKGSAREALHSWSTDLETVQAMSHAYNRELKTLGG